MIIEAGLTRYEAVNEEIEKQLKKQNKVTVTVIAKMQSAIQWAAAKS